MYAVCTLVHQNRDRSVSARVGYMLCHFLHDERIADHKSYDFRCIEPGLLAENRTVIKHHEHHQPRLAQSFLNRTFQFSKGPCDLGCLPELDHIGMPNSRLERRSEE